jgi:uncharacterized membrane protein YphA (DoxX/SURF4 family)
MGVAPAAAAPIRGGLVQTIIDNRYLVLLCRLILAVFFLLSSYGKLVNIQEYSINAIYSFQVLPLTPIDVVPFLGTIFPFIELLCGLGLLFGVLTRLSALGVVLMSTVFFLAKAHVLYIQGRTEFECGCFGAIIGTLASFTIFLDIPMLIMGLILLFTNTRDWLAFRKFLPEAWKTKLNLVW